MSKTLSDALKTHLAQPVTTMTTCWDITRQDGMVFAFTSFDQDLLIDGPAGDLLYKSIAGFTRTAITTEMTLAVDQLEVLGYFDSGDITLPDLRNGLFDYATIHLFGMNWANLSQGPIALRGGTFGECTASQDGTFKTELRGLTQALVQEFGDLLSPLCRANLGDLKCKVPIVPPNWSSHTDYTAGDFTDGGSYVRPATQSTDALNVAIFQCTVGGFSGTSEPSWDTTVGNVTTDGAVTWLCIQPYRLIGTVGTVIDQCNFTTAAPLVFRVNAATNFASITITEIMSAGTAIEVTDGINTVSILFAFVTSIAAAYSDIIAALPGSLDMTVMDLPPAAVSLLNNSGAQGRISKTGDTHDGVVIGNFSDGYLNAGTLTWLTGNNAGRSIEIKQYVQGTDTVTLWLSAFYAIQPGDTFFYNPGCDLRRDTCFIKFGNNLNNRSEPDVPGIDTLTNYPQAQ